MNDILEERNKGDLIHHYTSIETLALILENQTVRFSRLDKVDDLSESEVFQRVDLSQFLFVNCWTYEDKESIPQWNIYTDDMRGVRLSLPRYFFQYHPFEIDRSSGHLIRAEREVPIEPDRILTDKHWIFPPFLLREDLFEKKVEYVDNLAGIYDGIIEASIGDEGTKINISEVGELAKYKSTDWSFQKELRYVLMVFPSTNEFSGGFEGEAQGQEFASHIAASLIKGEGVNTTFIDLPINPELLDDIVVTVGPRATNGEKVIVRALVDKFTSNGTVKPSTLSGSIR